MSYNITDFSELEIEVTDSVRTWYIPKFRIYMTVDEPYCYLYWTDTEKGSPGITRKLILDYNDVTFGMLTPTSASEVKLTIEGYMISAFPSLSGYVPYTGATNNVDLGTYGLTADYVAFNQTPTTGPGHAQIGYVGATQALAYDFDNTNVRCQIGQQLYAFVKNAEAVTITKGQAVYLYQASGNKATIKLAKNTSDQYSAKTLGLAAEDISAGQNGLVICQGTLDGLNTSMFLAGDTLYLAKTFGDLTATKPYAPEHLVYIGVVERANAGAGQIYVRPQNGYELSEIHDVDLITTPPTNGQVLTYNSSTQLWTAQTPSSGSGTVTSIATSSPITGGTITTSGTIGINNAKADGTTKGAATFETNDFDDNGSGLIKIDYTNGQAANASAKGFLTSTDWSTFNAKEPALTKGNLTEATSSVLTISGGTSAVIGSGTSIQVKQASGAQSGYLSSTDWTTFNNKGTGTVTSIATSSPITGGTITTSGTIGINNAVADGSTKGAAAFTASDFNDNGSGVISIDYTNGQAASGSNKGFLTSADWTTFNSKEPALTKGNLTEATSSVLTITGGTSAVIGSGTSIQVKQANGSQSGFLATADWTTFNGKQDALVSGTNIKTVNGITLLGSGDVDIHGLTINVQALTSSPADGATIYFGTLPKAPVTVGATSKIFIRKAGTIKHAEIYCYSGTAGTAESWSLYIRKNNTTDTLIATVAAATNERVFTNSSLSIAMAVGDYFEIKAINPTWATNPLTTIFGGYIYIE